MDMLRVLDHELGKQYLYKTRNGTLGASVVPDHQNPQNYELAVLRWDESGSFCEIEYDTPITNDVLRNLTLEEVNATLSEIEGYSKKFKKFRKKHL